MYILRNVEEKDLESLYELSLQAVFISLPANKDLLEKKIKNSLASFTGKLVKKEDLNFIFVLEDSHTKKVIGVSMIHSQHGTEKEPHFYLEVSKEEKFSTTINTGFTHGTLKLGYDTNGPTEIGGLVLDPSYRGNPQKLGKQISFIRFLYIGMHRDKFKDQIHSELMPPFDSEGKSALWEAIGRRFLNMDYDEADILSRSNKEFILSLYPSENIYMALLPMDARNSIGQVGKETQPVKTMLESIGFTYKDQVDPFDGGPHYGSRVDDIEPIKNILNSNDISISFESQNKENDYKNFLATTDTAYHFSAVKVSGRLHNKKLILDEKFEGIIAEKPVIMPI